MTGLTEFLLARIAEDEAAAQGASLGVRVLVDNRPSFGRPDRTAGALPGVVLPAARVLAQCAGFRAIVELHAPFEAYRNQPLACATCVKVDEGGSYILTETEDVFPCQTLRALATTYADHPDYRAEWVL